MADQGKAKIDQPARQAAGIHRLARQQEEGNGEQGEAVRAIDHLQRDELPVEGAEVPHQRAGGDDQCEGDGHAEEDRAQKHEGEDGDRHDTPSATLVSMAGPPGPPRTTSMRSPRISRVSPMPETIAAA